jgi:hypothetical protein
MRKIKPFPSFELQKSLFSNGTKPHLTSSEILVAQFLLSVRYMKGKIYPKIETIADATQLSEKTVWRSIEGLVQKGRLISVRTQTSNHYFFVYDLTDLNTYFNSYLKQTYPQLKKAMEALPNALKLVTYRSSP